METQSHFNAKGLLPLLIVFFLLTQAALYGHDSREHAQNKHWIYQKQGRTHQVDGHFYLYKQGVVWIEQNNGQLLKLPLEQLSRKDRFYVMERYAAIQILNEKRQAWAHHKPSASTASPALRFFTVNTDPLSIDAAFQPFKSSVKTRWDANYFYVESNGLPTTHPMMKGITGWQQQVPIPQCYIGTNAWSIPLNPTLATTPVPVNPNHFIRGAIAIAVNGIAIFNPFTNTGVDALVDGQLDEWGGHCGRADDYHYHIAPMSLYDHTSPTLPIAYALDGFAVYGKLEPDGSPMKTLDANHGHNGADGVYHYHGTTAFPYMIGNMVGKVTEDATLQIIPQAAAKPVRPSLTPLSGAVITGCTANATQTGYTLAYTRNGQSYSVVYSWTPTGVYTFNFVAPTGTTTSTYNGAAPCKVATNSRDLRANELNLKVYPNPTRQQLYLDLPTEIKEAEVQQIALFSLQGELVYRRAHFSSSLDLSSLPKGIYFLQVKLEGRQINRKVILL